MYANQAISFLAIMLCNILALELDSVRLYDRKSGELSLSNGVVNITLSEKGYILGIQYNDIMENVFNDQPVDPIHPWRRSYGWKENDRGYYDTVANNALNKARETIYEKITCSSYKIITMSEKRVTVKFSRMFNISDPSMGAPAHIHVYFSVSKFVSGVYSWSVFHHTKDMPPGTIQDYRMALKLRPQTFDYSVISDDRQRIMPDFFDPYPERSQETIIPEARNLTSPSNPLFKYEVDHKYHYLLPLKDHNVYGWISNTSTKVGVWLVNPNKVEYVSGGPLKQCLTVQTGAILLNSLQSSHLTSSALKLPKGVEWRKTYGPFLIYLNSGKKPNRLWEDAKSRAHSEAKLWPYFWAAKGIVGIQNYPPKHHRVYVDGTLKLVDPFLSHFIDLTKAWIGLKISDSSSLWSQANLGYEFWANPAVNGSFSIQNVRPGVYDLVGFIPGVYGELRVPSAINISNSGSDVKIGDIEFRPPRNAPTIWEIGYPDRDSREFFVPEMNPRSKFPYPSNGPHRFRNFGAWEAYGKAFSKSEFGGLAYFVNKSNWSRDWWYVQPTLFTARNASVAPTTWRVVFNLSQQPSRSSLFYLRIGVASSSFAVLRVYVNSMKKRPLFDSGFCNCTVGNRDNAMARGTSYGIYNMYDVQINGFRLSQGENTVYLRQSQVGSPLVYLMYDYLRLEGPLA